ncbi:MAG: glycosyltransferase family 4 protein, partial [Betaproteobacteria bacterium]|nr:glycosyltransferase family 4 protein [Betaproteobacteria bacterium]
DLAFYLAGQGNAVKVLTSRQRYDDAAAVLAPHEHERGVEIVRVWSTRFGRGGLFGRALDYLSFYVSAFLALLFHVRAGDLVLCKTDPPMLGVLAALLARIRRVHRVNWLQDVFPEVAQAAGMRLARGAVSGAVAAVRDWSLRGATNAVLGERMKSLLQARGVASLVVLPNWADGAAIHPLPAADNPLRAEWSLADRFVVGYSGNLGRVHESATIIDAAERLRHDSSVVFLFIGGGKESDALRRSVLQRGLPNVLFRPYQPRAALAHSLTLPDVHLVSLRPAFEGMVVPSKVYGVMAAGRPCVFIGDDKGELASMLREGDCGVTVPVGDGEALAHAIVALRDDPARCAAMGAAARRMFEARFDLPVALAGWDRVLAGVASVTNGPAA